MQQNKGDGHSGESSQHRKRRWINSYDAVLWALVFLLALWFLLVPLGLGVWWIWLRNPPINAADLATLMKAVPGLWWPLILVVALVLFRADLAATMRRLRKWTGWGNTLELDPERLQDLEVEAKAAEAEQREKPPAPAPIEPAAPTAATSVTEDELFDLASRDYKLAIARLAMAIEGSLAEIAGQLGLVDSRTQSARQILTKLIQLELVTPASLSSFLNFWAVRNEVIHGRNVELDKDSVAALLQSGLSLLRIIKTIPSRMFTVEEVVTVYSDPQGAIAADDLRGVILRPGGENAEGLGPYPTTRLYKIGTPVSWAWNLGRRYSRMWYRDKNGEIRVAWDQSFEFVGQELTLSSDENERSRRG